MYIKVHLKLLFFTFFPTSLHLLDHYHHHHQHHYP
jgi:hypothetical protein